MCASCCRARADPLEKEEEEEEEEGLFIANAVNEEDSKGEEEEEEEEEEGLFKANAVNEEDPERDRATPA